MRGFVQIVGLSFLFSLHALESRSALNPVFDGSAKRDQLWKKIEATEYPRKPGLRSFPGLLDVFKSFTSLDESFDTSSDEMPQGRRKVIHPLGTVAKVEWVSEPGVQHYTGLFQSGAIGLARLSLATNPALNGFMPGVALKWMRDGEPSVNLHLLHDLDGQGRDWNFFKHEMSNNLPAPNSNIMKLGEAIFKSVCKNPRYLPVDHLAQTSRTGAKVENPRWPFVLKIVPHPSLRTRDESRKDFRVQLESLEVGFDLYEVFAQATPSSPFERVGKIRLQSRFISSSFGDQNLFFQHNSCR